MSDPDHATRLLPPSSTPLERALVQAIARAAGIPAPLRQLWDVSTCPVHLLPWLAWALGIEVWRSNWPENVKRARIRASVPVHKSKGSVASVRSVIESFGADMALREWWQTTPPGTPHTFDVTLTIRPSLPQDATFQSDIITAINQTKPVRSHFTFSIAQSAATAVGIAAGLRQLTFQRLHLIASDIVPAFAPLGIPTAVRPIQVHRLNLL